MTKDEEIVKLAYAMALGPHRFKDLFQLLDQRLDERISGDVILDDIIEPAFKTLIPHFENALSLIEAQGRQRDTSNSSIKLINADSRPALLIHTDGRVYHANQAATEILGIQNDSLLDEALFERGHYKSLMKTLRNLDDFDVNKTIQILGMASPINGNTFKVALTKLLSSEGQVIGHISAINISWNPVTAKRFKSMFKITPVEVEITRAIVTGMSLANLAKQRKRSLNTVRLQTKKLLQKLNLRSQTELACLYSGFSRYSLSDDKTLEESELEDESWPRQHILMRPEGRVLDYEILGATHANPVLFLPALIGGMTVTPRIEKAIKNLNIRLIMVWRPGMANSNGNNPPSLKGFEDYAKDIEALLDRLGIKKCPVIAHITASSFAYGLAHHIPQRLTRLVAVNGIVPVIEGPHLKLLNRIERLRLLSMRKAPAISRMILIGGLAKIDAGYDEEWIRSHLDNNRYDIKTTKEPAIRRGFRTNFTATTRQGYESFSNELSMAILDWRNFVESCRVPATYLTGENNVGFTEDVVRAYHDETPNFEIEIIPETGHLLFYQRPDIVFERALTPTSQIK